MDGALPHDAADPSLGGGDPADPVAIVDAAVEAGVAAPDAEPVQPDPDREALVKEWWARTSETADFTAAVEQYQRDLETINGGTDAEVSDPAEITVQHVYRNAVATVSLTVPELSSITWKPREEVRPIPGVPLPPGIAQALAQRRQAQQGLAAVVSLLHLRFAETGNHQEKIEAWVQDATHFRMAIFKVWFQRDLARDPTGRTRLPDEQDLLGRIRVLIEQYDRGEFTKDDAQHAELRQALQAVGRTEQDVRRGIVLELVPLSQYRCDPAVTGPEYLETARWERNDVLMTRAEVLATFDHLTVDDLNHGATYSADATGRFVRQQQRDRTDTAGTVRDDSAPQTMKDDDWLLVAEIYDYQHNNRLTLIDGVPFPVREDPLDDTAIGQSPFVVLVLNRRHGSLAGYSDTEMQAKPQRQLNRLRSQEEDSRERAQARWAVDAGAVPDATGLKAAIQAPPGTITPIKSQTKPGEFEKAFINLAGNNTHNAQDFRLSAQTLTQEMRKMSALPEQASGELGAAEFSSEVQVAAAGANALARYRQARIKRALKRLADKIGQLILMNVSQDLAVRLTGPLAAFYYPPTPMARRELYEGLTITAEVALDQQLDYARRADSLAKLIDSFAKAGVSFDREVAARLLAKFLMLGEEGDDLVQADPNDLIGRLAQAMQDHPEGLAPEAAQILVQMAQQVAARAAAMAVQQAALDPQAAATAPPQGP